ncbi:MAG TPA: hypothetical protein ENL06_00990 [Candidatus Portnoybacteria bacterium]|nr:hypothetical protein [Candidatus Portnoybacteria bacterium]
MQKENFNQWIRVIHNLTYPENTIIDSATDFARALKSIKNILNESNNIIDYLKDDSKQISFFSSWQVTEERIKAHLISKNNDWKKEIEEVEKHGYFNGQIGFILEFSGIWDYYENNKNCNWNADIDKKYFDKFKNYSEIAIIIFAENYENRINDENYIFERAVLVKDDYLTDSSAYRKNLLSTNQVKNNIKRDHSWKRLLRVVDDKKWKGNLVRQVFDDVMRCPGDFSEDNIKNALKKIISSREGKLENWRDYFINSPALFDYSRQGFIRFEGENKIRIYKESQSNFYQVEMYTYYLWGKYIKPLNFNSIYYYAVTSIGDISRIIFEKAQYKCSITYDNGYKIEFYSLNNNEFDDGFKNNLQEKGFVYNIEIHKYEFALNNIKTEDDLKKLFEEVILNLP